jgi:hypothetical protein
MNMLAYPTVVDQDINGQWRVHKHVYWAREDYHAKSNDVVEVRTSQSDQPVAQRKMKWPQYIYTNAWQ